ncbi:MAG: hypothetical protein ACREAN_03865 [Nitrosopumilaceae archaeon]
MKKSYIVAGIVIGAVTLSVVFVLQWFEQNSNKNVISTMPGITQLDTMGEFLPSNSYFLVSISIPNGIVIYTKGNVTFNNCALIYQNKSIDKNDLGMGQPLIILENYTVLNPINSYEKDILLNDTSVLGFNCEYPSVEMWWPHLFLDKSIYNSGDVLILRGSFGNMSNSSSSILTAFVSNAGPPYYFWDNPNLTPSPPISIMDKRDIALNSTGKFEYSFKIPDNVQHDSVLTVGIKNKDKLYTIILRVQ